MIQVGDIVKVEHGGDVVEGVVVLVGRSGVGVDVHGSIWTVPASGKRTKDGRRLFVPSAAELVALEAKRRRDDAVQELIATCTQIKHAVRLSCHDWTDEQLAGIRLDAEALLHRCGGAPW